MLHQLNIKEFSNEVHYRREEALALIGKMGITTYREALTLSCCTDDWKLPEPEKAWTAPTFDDLYNGFWSGAQKVGFEVRATNEQCKALAAAALAAGEWHINSDALTRRQAAQLLNDYNA